MPHVIVQIYPGRSEQQKARLAQRTVADIVPTSIPLDQVAEGYRAMDERRAIKALLRP